MPQSELFVYVLWVSLLSGKMREWTLLETPKGVYSYAIEHLYQTNKKRAVVELDSKLHAKLDRSVLRNKIVLFSLLFLDGVHSPLRSATRAKLGTFACCEPADDILFTFKLPLCERD